MIVCPLSVKHNDSVAVAELPTLPRERTLSNGISSLRDEELVALLLGSGGAGRPVGRLARTVVDLIDHASGSPSVQALTAVPGMGPAKSACILAALELGRRVLAPARTKVRSPSDVVPILSHYADRKQECFVAVTLNGAHEVIRVKLISVGLVNRTIVHPREVFASAIGDRAAAIIVAHNHPSGNLDPSGEDKEITSRLLEAGQLLGIPVLDHIIVSSRGYYSFLENDGL